jgi:hypothetical protein
MLPARLFSEYIGYNPSYSSKTIAGGNKTSTLNKSSAGAVYGGAKGNPSELENLMAKFNNSLAI